METRLLALAAWAVLVGAVLSPAAAGLYMVARDSGCGALGWLVALPATAALFVASMAWTPRKHRGRGRGRA